MFDVIRFSLYKSPVAARAGFLALQRRLEASLMPTRATAVATGKSPAGAKSDSPVPTYVEPSGS